MIEGCKLRADKIDKIFKRNPTYTVRQDCFLLSPNMSIFNVSLLTILAIRGTSMGMKTSEDSRDIEYGVIFVEHAAD